MKKKYDKDYKLLIEKLNDLFEIDKDKNEKEENPAEQLKGIIVEKHKQIENIPTEELKKIKAKVKLGVTDIDYLTEKEKFQLEDINKNKKLSYKQAVWRMVGEIDSKKIMENYEKFMQNNEIFRTVYLYKGLEEPVKVIYANREKTFPIHDIRNVNYEKQNFLIKNILAAEARREYNVESDATLRLQGFLTGANEMLVVISVYANLPCPMGIREILYQIFEGMRPDNSNVPVADEKTIRQMNEQLRKKSVDYWKELMRPTGKSLTVPGETTGTDIIGNKRYEKIVLYQEVGEELTTKITEYCKKSGTSVKALFLYAWADLLGRYHNEENPIMAVACNGEKMNIIPVKISRNPKNHDRIHDIDSQLTQSEKYSSCAVSDVEAAVGVKFTEYFRMLHNFMEFNELDDLGKNNGDIAAINGIQADDTDINLFVSYQMFENNVMLTYTSKGGILELMLDNLHELFLEELSELMIPNSARFDKKTFIKVDDTDEAKLYKIRVAQIALYLKNAGIFNSITVEEIMKLAEYCKLRTYLAGDAVITEKSQLSKIYILGEGKMEESRMADDGMVKSLRIVKKGSILGVESLFAGGEAPTTYTVLSTQAKIVEIDKDILTEALRRKPEGWIALLEKENDQKRKLQRLWTMV